MAFKSVPVSEFSKGKEGLTAFRDRRRANLSKPLTIPGSILKETGVTPKVKEQQARALLSIYKDPVTFQERHGIMGGAGGGFPGLQVAAATAPLQAAAFTARLFGVKGKGDIKPIDPGFAVAAKAAGVGGEVGEHLRTILGGDPKHVFDEKMRLRKRIAADPLAAGAVFGSTDMWMGTEGYTGTIDMLNRMTEKAMRGELSDTEKEFLEKQMVFARDDAKFGRLVARKAAVVKQREDVEAARRRAPGRTQTILTRRVD